MNPLLAARRIGIIKLTSLGDVLLATPVAANLRKARRDAFITWIVEERFAEALVNNPDLDEVIALPRLGWPGWRWRRMGAGGFLWALRDSVRRLRALRLEAVIDLQGLLKSGVLALASGARWRIAGSRAREGSRYLANVIVPQLPPEAGPRDGYLHFLEHLGVPIADRRLVYRVAESDREAGSRILQGLRAGPVIAFAAASSLCIKDWPVQRYAMLGDRLAETTGANILLLGSERDQREAALIQGGMKGKAFDLTGRTTIGQLAAVLERCSLLVAGDSGPLFLAKAVGTRVVGLFGPTNASAFASVLGSENIVWKPPVCSPCRDWKCKSKECMLAITVEHVMARATRLLASQSRRPGRERALVKGAS